MENRIRQLQEELGQLQAELAQSQEDLKKTRSEIWLLHQIGSAMRTTLNLREVLYVILTAVTSGEGLGFNRAMLFLLSKDRSTLEGEMAIGPTSPGEAYHTWKAIEEERLSLDKIVEMFHRIDSHVIKAPLHSMVKELKIPINESGGILALSVLEAMNFKATTAEERQKINDPILDKLQADIFLSVPLKGKHNVQGVLLVDNMITKKSISKDEMRILTMFADQAGLAIENAYLFEETKFQAHTDSLTRLWNHGYFQNSLESFVEQARLAKNSITLAMIDLDNFKAYNDNLGHQKGDVALREVALTLKKRMRQEDLLCRYGGEEFAVIMPHINKNDAFTIIERLRVAIEGTFIRTENKPTLIPPLTISSGIASFPVDARDKEELIRQADEALYNAKSQGKNKTIIFS